MQRRLIRRLALRQEEVEYDQYTQDGLIGPELRLALQQRIAAAVELDRAGDVIEDQDEADQLAMLIQHRRHLCPQDRRRQQSGLLHDDRQCPFPQACGSW